MRNVSAMFCKKKANAFARKVLFRSVTVTVMYARIM